MLVGKEYYTGLRNCILKTQGKIWIFCKEETIDEHVLYKAGSFLMTEWDDHANALAKQSLHRETFLDDNKVPSSLNI